MVARAVWAAAELFAVRVWLSRNVSTLPLPVLLTTLTPTCVLAPRVTRDWPEESNATLRRAVSGVERVARFVPGLPNTCLYRALARYRVYRRMGVPVEFVMGVVPLGDGNLKGHAWLEFGGRPLFETLDSDFHVTLRHPSPVSPASPPAPTAAVSSLHQRPSS